MYVNCHVTDERHFNSMNTDLQFRKGARTKGEEEDTDLFMHQ